MASVYEQYYERQPQAVKVIAVAGIALLGYSLYRNYKKKQDEKQANQAALLAQQELADLANQGIHPTLPLSQFENLSQTIVEAINGCGTDEDAIFSAFKQLNNEADIRQLITTFGVRYARPCAATDPVSYSIWLVNDQAFGGPLATLLRYDLSDSDIEYINSIMRGKGINYQF
jgi:type II secretory pathway pseudopilin PulG